MDNERLLQPAMSWGKHAAAAVARLVPVYLSQCFIFPIRTLHQSVHYNGAIEIPITGIFCLDFDRLRGASC